MKSETIRIPGVHYTLKQLLDMDRVPVPGNSGETRWNNRYCQIETTYWNIADTVVDPERVKEERERLLLPLLLLPEYLYRKLCIYHCRLVCKALHSCPFQPPLRIYRPDRLRCILLYDASVLLVYFAYYALSSSLSCSMVIVRSHLPETN